LVLTITDFKYPLVPNSNSLSGALAIKLWGTTVVSFNRTVSVRPAHNNSGPNRRVLVKFHTEDYLLKPAHQFYYYTRYTYIYIYVCVCVCVCFYCIYIYIYIYICVCVWCVCVCLYTHTHTHTHIYIYIYTYIHSCSLLSIIMPRIADVDWCDDGMKTIKYLRAVVDSVCPTGLEIHFFSAFNTVSNKSQSSMRLCIPLYNLKIDNTLEHTRIYIIRRLFIFLIT